MTGAGLFTFSIFKSQTNYFIYSVWTYNHFSTAGYWFKHFDQVKKLMRSDMHAFCADLPSYCNKRSTVTVCICNTGDKVCSARSQCSKAYTSFAGKSEDASGSVKFIYKTGETVAAADVTAQTTADVQEGNFFTRLWQRIVNLFKF